METLHFGHAGSTRMLADARVCWWPNILKEIEDRTKSCVDCMESGKNINYE